MVRCSFCINYNDESICRTCDQNPQYSSKFKGTKLYKAEMERRSYLELLVLLENDFDDEYQ